MGKSGGDSKTAEAGREHATHVINPFCVICDQTCIVPLTPRVEGLLDGLG